MENTFENEVTIHASIDLVRAYLSDPFNLKTWNYAIVKIEKLDEKNYLLYRNYETINELENLYILENTPHNIIFQMTGGRVNYNTTFTLKNHHLKSTSVVETIKIVNERFNFFNAIAKFIHSYMKNAFKENLLVLKKLLEIRN